VLVLIGGHGTGGRDFSEDIRLVKDSMATSSSGKVTSYQYEVAFKKSRDF
jgi:hypothetical protein